MAKRIFQNKSEPPLVTDQGRTPLCYYHKQSITHFCVKKKCTLPLCQECLPIHKKEHISNKQIPNEGILQFETAREDALNAFHQRKQQMIKVDSHISQTQQKFKNRIVQYKAKINQIINNLLDKFCEDCLVTDGYLQIIGEIQERTAQIRRGSLKQLIRYYEDIYGAQHFRKLYKMYSGQYLTNFKFQLDKKELQKLCKEGIKNLNFDAQKPTKQNKQNELSKQTPPKQMMGEIVSQMPQIITYKDNLQAKTPNLGYVKKVITEQDEQSQITSYRLLKEKKKSEQGNIYTKKSSNIDPTWKAPSHNTSNVSQRSKSKKKGLSLSKSHKDLVSPPASSVEPSLNCRQKEKRASWKDFVNMKQIHPDNQTNVSSQPSSVLNPKQMRDLIIKKKIEQKQKDLRTNKSVEFIIPEKIRN